MHRIWTMAMKDIRILSRDYLAMFFIIAFPFIMGLFFGFIGAGFGEQSEGGTRLAFVDEDGSEYSARFREAIAKNESLEILDMERDAAVDGVRRGQLSGYVVVPSGFGESAGILWANPPTIEIGIDPSRQAEGMLMQGHSMQAMGSLIQARFADSASMRSQVRKMSENVAGNEEMSATQRMVWGGVFAAVDTLLVQLDVARTAEANESSEADKKTDAALTMPGMNLAHIDLKQITAPPSQRDQVMAKLRSPWDISFPSAIMWGVMGTVAGFAVSIARERSEGTFLRLTVAPVARIHVLAGKGLACFLMTGTVLTLMLVCAKLLGIQVTSAPLLMIAILCVSLSFVGLMMLMAVIGKSEQAVGGAGWASIVIMAMFGGGMVPLVFLPSFMRTISHFSPFKWGVLALEGAIWRGFTPAEMAVPCLVLLGMGAAGFLIGARVLNRQAV